MRAVALLIENDRVALIERHRAGRHYFTFPGGGVGTSETPEQTVVREMQEETGLLVTVTRLIAEVWYKGNQQYYFLAGHEVVNHGSGEYVRGMAYINTAEGWFALLKRGVTGTFHNLREQHLDRMWMNSPSAITTARKQMVSEQYGLLLRSVARG